MAFDRVLKYIIALDWWRNHRKLKINNNYEYKMAAWPQPKNSKMSVVTGEVKKQLSGGLEKTITFTLTA